MEEKNENPVVEEVKATEEVKTDVKAEAKDEVLKEGGDMKVKPKKPKQLVKTDTIHNIVTSDGAYIYKSSKGGYSYTYHKGSAKMYVNINTAKAQAKRLSKRFPSTEFKIETTKLDKEILV